MIRYALQCDDGHGFEAWFGDSAAYDDQAARGLGTLAVLKQLEWAARDGRQHLYLGYWIAGHAKMDYKRRFQPLEGFNGRIWARLQA